VHYVALLLFIFRYCFQHNITAIIIKEQKFKSTKWTKSIAIGSYEKALRHRVKQPPVELRTLVLCCVLIEFVLLWHLLLIKLVLLRHLEENRTKCFQLGLGPVIANCVLVASLTVCRRIIGLN